jgi:hypothetical protein
MKLEISRHIFEKNTQLSNFMKIRQVGTQLFHADGRKDGQTEMTKLVVVFRNFLQAPKKVGEPLHKTPLAAFFQS